MTHVQSDLFKEDFDVEEWLRGERLPIFAGQYGKNAVLAGLVISAPHVGFDIGTGPIAQHLARYFESALVLACGFRSRKKGAIIDVNRPTEKILDREAEPRLVTERAMSVYRRYQALLYELAGSVPVPLLFEIHGCSTHNTSQNGGNQDDIPFQVIELTTFGFTESDIRQVKRHYEDVLKPLYEFPWSMKASCLHEDLHYAVEHNGECMRVPFKNRGSEARNCGAFRETCARRVVQIELPSNARYTPTQQYASAAVLGELLREILWGLPDTSPLTHSFKPTQ